LTRSQIVLVLLAGVGGSAVASDAVELPDVELLEFLGSWDAEVDEWQEFFDSLPEIVDATSSSDEQNDRRMTGEPD